MAGKKAAASKGTGSTKKTSTRKKTATAAGKSAAAKKATKKSAPATKAPAKKTTTKRTTTKKTAAKKTAKKAPSTGTQKKTTKASAKKDSTKGSPRLVVREDESPWTAAELDAVRTDLEAEIERVRAEIASAELDLSEFLKEPIDGAGDDQADAGAKSFEREHELSLVAGTRAGLEQTIHALQRLEDGTYGVCESCGNPIGKLRLQAYPRATLCVPCKSKQERR